MPSLDAWGWNDAFARAFEEHAGPGAVPGRVVLEHNHVYRVVVEDGEVLAEAAGRLKHQASRRSELPAVGDWVVLRTTGGGDRRQIKAVLPRASCFSRKSAGEWTEEQVVAANIDTVFLVSGLDGDFNPRRIERYLLLARQSQAAPVIILNKADVADDVAEVVAEVTAIAGDTPVIAVSASTGFGLDRLQPYLGAGRTVALLGSSGVGKSTLVNRLLGESLLPTRDVRESDSRGRHTSVHRQLIAMPSGGLIIDTPGMRELQLWGVDEVLTGGFDDVAALAGHCRFRDCRHRQEPGCAVREAVEDGTLAPDRFESYMKLQEEQAAHERRVNERALLEQKRNSKVISRSLKAMQKQRGR